MQSAFRIRCATGRACIALWCFSAACLPDCHSLKHRICKAAKDGKSVELLLCFFVLSLRGHVFLLSLRGHVYSLAVVAAASFSLFAVVARGACSFLLSSLPAPFCCCRCGVAFFVLSLRGRFFAVVAGTGVHSLTGFLGPRNDNKKQHKATTAKKTRVPAKDTTA